MMRKYWAHACLLVLGVAMSATAAQAQQAFSDAFAGFGSNDKAPIQIEAQQLEVHDKQNTATFVGDVVVTQGDARLKASHLEVFYRGNSDAKRTTDQKISKLHAWGNVFVSSKDQTATGDDATFDMNQQVMVMTGKRVVLSQGKNVVVGSRLVVNLKTGKADLKAPHSGGRVKVLIQPKSN